MAMTAIRGATAAECGRLLLVGQPGAGFAQRVAFAALCAGYCAGRLLWPAVTAGIEHVAVDVQGRRTDLSNRNG